MPAHSPQQTLDLAIEHHRAGRLTEAEALYQQLVVAHPDQPDPLHLLGLVAHHTGDLQTARDMMQRAIAINPMRAHYYSNLGLLLQDLGVLDDAVCALMTALRLQPDLAAAHYNLGNVHSQQRRWAEAIADYRAALRLQPDYPDASNNLCTALNYEGLLDEAVALSRAALRRDPADATAFNNLANALKEQGRLEEAMQGYRESMTANPSAHGLQSNLIYTAYFHPGFDAEALAREHREWNRRHAEPLRAEIRPHPNERSPERRLRVGYVSPDFWGQAEAYFVVPLIEAHDHGQFEIHAYATLDKPDVITGRVQRAVDHWHEVRTLSDAALAEKIRADGIDVLVDLTMHMAQNRLLTFARKPAPVQVTWLAYPGSTGLETMDYRLTDRFMEPEGTAFTYSSEEAIRLPDAWCCYHPLCEPLEPGELPATRHGFVTFGSLNNFCKLNDRVLTLWARVLEAVENSRLVLLAKSGSHRQRTQDFFRQSGIDPARIEFAGWSRRNEYLLRYRAIDIGLDPFPYNGITTTCDALWMGVPVITLVGKMAAARAGWSLLSTAGLADLAAETEDDYVRIATGLARDLPRLTTLRRSLRTRLEASPLMDAPRFARHVEAAFRSMWQHWCASPFR